jgi:hypothetical protein
MKNFLLGAVLALFLTFSTAGAVSIYPPHQECTSCGPESLPLLTVVATGDYDAAGAPTENFDGAVLQLWQCRAPVDFPSKTFGCFRMFGDVDRFVEDGDTNISIAAFDLEYTAWEPYIHLVAKEATNPGGFGWVLDIAFAGRAKRCTELPF